MIKFLRIDTRLLHGQVAMTWLSEIKATSILIVSDEAANDEMAKAALKMAKPNGYNLAIRDVEGGAALLNDPRAQGIDIFVIVKTVNETWRLLQQIQGVDHINIGGLITKEGTGRMLYGGVTVTDEDFELLKEMEQKVKEMEFRMVPTNTKRHLSDFQ